MRLTSLTCLFLAYLIGLATISHAGNKLMMIKNGEELIMLNSMLIERLGTIQKDGKIILSGDVTHEDGKVIIKLYKLQQIDPSNEENIFSPEIFEKDLPYQIFLREETLSEIPLPSRGENK